MAKNDDDKKNEPTHEYVSFEDAMGEKDWGLIFDENGRLKGMFIPKDLTDSPVPQSILHICEEFFGVDLEEENLIKRTLH